MTAVAEANQLSDVEVRRSGQTVQNIKQLNRSVDMCISACEYLPATISRRQKNIQSVLTSQPELLGELGKLANVLLEHIEAETAVLAPLLELRISTSFKN